MTTLDEFFTSLHHGSRSNERYGYWQYYMHERGDGAVAEFLEGLLDAVGQSVDDGDWPRVIRLIREWDRTYATWFIDEHPWTNQIHNDSAPWTTLRRPLEDCRILLVSSGGFHREEDPPFGPGISPAEQARNFKEFLETRPTMRLIPTEYPRDRLRISHPSYDHSAARLDLNVLFPLDRLVEAAQTGAIGEVAQQHVSYMGLTSPRRIERDLVPAVIEAAKDQDVDAALLSPGCPGCHLTISQVARGLEGAGVATVTVYLDIYRRWAIERLKMPRVLFTPFFLGRLFGAPFDTERQRDTVGRCLALLRGAAEPGATDTAPFGWRSNPTMPALATAGVEAAI
jgi:hypothetical protein